MARDVSKSSIKILDDIDTRNRIVELYNSKDQKSINLWANLIIEEILKLVEFNNEEYKIINEGIIINRKWQESEVGAHDIRQIGFKIHKLAKEEDNLLKKAALRTIGHAISSAHMQEHGIVASDYYIKFINILYDNDITKVSDARNMQLKLIEKI